MDWIFPHVAGSILSSMSNLKRFHRSREFERAGTPTSPIVIDGEEENEVEAILRHNGKGARHLYLVMWKGYPITEASWELKWTSEMLP